MPETRAGRLQRRLAELPVHVEKARVEIEAIELPSYPDGPRPTSTIILTGSGELGMGENVAWTAEDHHLFRAEVSDRLPANRGTIGDLSRQLQTSCTDPYQASAFESAAIDLALRQARTNLEEIAEASYQELRYVRSFGAAEDPLPELVSHSQQAPSVEVKLDVHPAWKPATIASLADLGTIAVLDFKHRGTQTQQVAVAAALRKPWLEDPGTRGLRPNGALAERFSLDAALTSEDPAGLLANLNPAAANLKAPRMGGILALLRAADFCMAHKKPFYLGGMFEVSVGRTQARELASLLTPQGPNDLAPIPRQPNDRFPASLSVPSGGRGFGHR